MSVRASEVYIIPNVSLGTTYTRLEGCHLPVPGAGPTEDER